MVRHSAVVFTILLVVLTFAVGCTKPMPKPAESAKAQSPKTEALETQPQNIEPQAAEPHSAVSFHDQCADILKNHVSDKGMVDYRTLKRKKPELRKILDKFNTLDPNEYKSWSKEGKIAFWINAYNIQMLKIIVDNYPIESSRILRLFWPPNSIRHIEGIWTNYKFLVMDEEFTLADIEQRFFCKEFDEPRVFLAVSHASFSGPPLRNEPYYGRRLHEQLDDQVKKFLSNPLAFRIDKEKQKVHLSAIFQSTWHGNYFIGKYGTDKKFKDQPPEMRAVLNFIIHYIPKQDASYLQTGNYTIEYLTYDWRLNE